MSISRIRAGVVSSCLAAALLLGSSQQVFAESDAYIQQADPSVSEEDISISQSDRSALEPGSSGNENEPLDISKMSLLEALFFSKYVHEVKSKIFKNWGSPQLTENRKLRVSFKVFPKGNIGRPTLVQSSGSEEMDKLALEAIRASEPFPPFPKEFKEPNLSIVVHFRYANHGEEFQEDEISKEEFF